VPVGIRFDDGYRAPPCSDMPPNDSKVRSQGSQIDFSPSRTSNLEAI